MLPEEHKILADGTKRLSCIHEVLHNKLNFICRNKNIIHSCFRHTAICIECFYWTFAK